MYRVISTEKVLFLYSHLPPSSSICTISSPSVKTPAKGSGVAVGSGVGVAVGSGVGSGVAVGHVLQDLLHVGGGHGAAVDHGDLGFVHDDHAQVFRVVRRDEAHEGGYQQGTRYLPVLVVLLGGAGLAAHV